MKTNIVKQENNWIGFEFKGYSGCAKIFDEGSVFGIGGGRISKLMIYRGDEWLFNYDRGLDFDRLPTGILSEIIQQLTKGDL